MKNGLTLILWGSWVAFSQGTLALVLFAWPELMSNGSYTVVYSIVPLTAWAWFALACFVTITVGLVTNRRNVLLPGLVSVLPTQFAFGYSIGVLTLSGVSSALIGTVQWLSIPVATLVLMIVRFVQTRKFEKELT